MRKTLAWGNLISLIYHTLKEVEEICLYLSKELMDLLGNSISSRSCFIKSNVLFPKISKKYVTDSIIHR